MILHAEKAMVKSMKHNDFAKMKKESYACSFQQKNRKNDKEPKSKK